MSTMRLLGFREQVSLCTGRQLGIWGQLPGMLQPLQHGLNGSGFRVGGWWS